MSNMFMFHPGTDLTGAKMDGANAKMEGAGHEEG